jgi:hypothetical protein
VFAASSAGRFVAALLRRVRGTAPALRHAMRTLSLLVMLLVGCGQLGYATRTPMVPVDPDLPPAVTPSLPESPLPVPRHATATSRHWRGLVTTGTVLTLVGLGLGVGGIVGNAQQEASDREADARCQREDPTGFCSLGNDLFQPFDRAPYIALGVTGALTTVSGLVLLGLGVHGRGIERARSSSP